MFQQLLRTTLAVLAVLSFLDLRLGGQEAVTSGPRPEMRALLDALAKGLNGTPEAWEAMAQERFSPDLLKQRSPDQRKTLFERIRGRFGTVTFGRVTREGPDAPLQVGVTGSTGVVGVIELTIEEGATPRIASISMNVNTNVGSRDDAAPGPDIPVNGRMTADELSRALDTHLSKLAADDAFSGVALVAKQDAIVFQKAYGFADRANRIPNMPQTRFNIGSINKSFTQLAIDQLVAQGKLSYTDTLGKFYPEYAQAVSRTATVQQLLSHTGGLADFFSPEFQQMAKDRFRSNADYFAFVGMLTPKFAPGARNEYCNGCYIAVGAIVEKVSGLPYEQYVAEHIFAPAGMTSTGYPQADSIEPALAIGYTRRGRDGALRSNVYMHGATGSAAGGGYSTALDLFRFAQAGRNGRLPGAKSGLGIAGGAPGTNAVLESNDTWTVVVLTNQDPPTGERLGTGIIRALAAPATQAVTK
jgi:CubicO group peptidase (beta-lactamase class C family)